MSEIWHPEDFLPAATNAEHALDEMVHAAAKACAVLSSTGMRRAIHALRASGYVNLADEIERNSHAALAAVAAARVVGGYIPAGEG
jgi:hypothetical protein